MLKSSLLACLNSGPSLDCLVLYVERERERERAGLGPRSFNHQAVGSKGSAEGERENMHY